jgi:phosphoglycolate phosphatase-like HAD superfamily hydrolase
MSNLLYALDFDGVICDSAIETAISGWKVARQLWTDMPEEPSAELIDGFRIVRPVMETGYEAVLIMRILFEKQDPYKFLAQYQSQFNHMIRRDEINVEGVKQRFGELRDNWIADDVASWIAVNPLFDGIKQKLQQLANQDVYIITTKQERFVKQIFEHNGIDFPAERIFGLDRQLSKEQVLKHLMFEHPEQTILFVEDRLPTLLRIIDDENLADIKLYFADWGYNTQEDKQIAQDKQQISTLTQADFAAL